MNYSVKKITFKTWDEYSNKVNALLKEGFVIDETIDKKEHGFDFGKTHTVRVKHEKQDREGIR